MFCGIEKTGKEQIRSRSLKTPSSDDDNIVITVLASAPWLRSHFLSSPQTGSTYRRIPYIKTARKLAALNSN